MFLYRVSILTNIRSRSNFVDVEKSRELVIQTIEMLVQPVAKGKFQISITYKPTNLETITLKFTRIIVKTRNCNISSSN